MTMVPSPNTLAVFDVAGANIRFGQTDAGIPFSVASDFAKSMGYLQASDATRLLGDDEKGQQIVLTPGGQQRVNVIYEDGMWELIFRSTLPGAKAIKSRVKAILREIRETGRYESPGAQSTEVALNDLDSIARIHEALGTAIAVARSEKDRADKAEAFQTAIEAGDGLTLRAFHKKYFSTITEKAFMDHLYGRGYLLNQRGKGTQRDNGTFRDGSQHRHPSAKGKPFFYLHGHGEIGGARRENTRVRPGAPELDLKARLIKDGLTANNNDTGQPRALEGQARPMLEAQR